MHFLIKKKTVEVGNRYNHINISSSIHVLLQYIWFYLIRVSKCVWLPKLVFSLLGRQVMIHLKIVVLRLQHTSKSPKGLVKIQNTLPECLGWSPRNYISNKVPSAVDATGQRPHIENLYLNTTTYEIIHQMLVKFIKCVQELLRRKLSQEPFSIIFIFLILNFSVLSLSVSQKDLMTSYIKQSESHRKQRAHSK